MIPLHGIKLPAFPIDDLTRIADLEYFEGPLVTHFRNPKGESFIFYWVDNDASHNRWMVIRLNERNVIKIANKVVSLDKIIPTESQDSFVYFVDLSENGNYEAIRQLRTSDIPKEYLPEAGACLLYDNPETKNSFPIFTEKSLSFPEVNEIPKTFTQAYSVLALLTTNIPSHFQSYPWRGGFSAVSFFRNIEEKLPEVQQPKLDKMQFTSPGYINFKLDRSTANFVSKCIIIVSDRKSDVRRAHTLLYNYIREEKLNKLPRNSPKWDSHNQQLKLFTLRMLKGLEISKTEPIFDAVSRPFEAAKITGTLVRRLRKLGRLKKDGVIDFPAPE